MSQHISEFLEEQAAQFVSGSLPAERQEEFQLLLRCHEELRDFAMGLAEVAAPFGLREMFTLPPAPDNLKSRVLSAALALPQTPCEAIVRSDPSAVVQWVNPAFSEMCGYSLEELKGRKLGPLLQGEKTDVSTANRLRESIKSGKHFHGTILNYHRDGHPYWAEIKMTPILDDAREPIFLIAREYARPDLALP